MNTSLARDIAAVMPAMLASGLFVKLCSILVPDGEFGDSGAPSGNFVPLMIGSPAVEVTDVPCMGATLAMKVDPTELKELAEILSDVPLHVVMGGYFPEVTSTMRAVVDGVAYEIMGAAADSLSVMTTLAVRELSI